MVLMVNIDPNAMPPATVQQFYNLLDKAHCSTA